MYMVYFTFYVFIWLGVHKKVIDGCAGLWKGFTPTDLIGYEYRAMYCYVGIWYIMYNVYVGLLICWYMRYYLYVVLGIICCRMV